MQVIFVENVSFFTTSCGEEGKRVKPEMVFGEEGMTTY